MVLRVLVDAELDVLAKRVGELLEAFLVLADLSDDIHAPLDDVLEADGENLALPTRTVDGRPSYA